MDTLQRINSMEGDADVGDGDVGSARHIILKQTEVAVTTKMRSATPGAWERSQVLGFKPRR